MAVAEEYLADYRVLSTQTRRNGDEYAVKLFDHAEFDAALPLPDPPH